MPSMPSMSAKILLAATCVAAFAGAAAADQPGKPAREPAVRPAIAFPDGRAVVEYNGVLARGENVLYSRRLGTGQYEVIFFQYIRHCTYTATLGLTGSSGSPPAGEIGVVGRVTDVRGVWVETRNSFGALADRPFHPLVSC
jgi:hypothetical protein